jgi:hypothetical protein
MKYFDGWASHAEMVKDFTLGEWNAATGQYEDAPIPDPIPDMATDEEILFAQYGGGPYDGYCRVLFQRDGVLYRVDASHCSCYGLEGQWSPEETSWAAEAMRVRKFNEYDMSQEAHKAFWVLVDANHSFTQDQSGADAQGGTMIRSGDRIATGTGASRRRLTDEEALAGGLPDPLTQAEWQALHDAALIEEGEALQRTFDARVKAEVRADERQQAVELCPLTTIDHIHALMERGAIQSTSMYANQLVRTLILPPEMDT